MTKQNEIIDSFKELDGQKAVAVSSTKATMLEVFRAYATTSFTQKDFATKLGKRTQHINHILRDMVKEGLIIRVGSSSQYYYQLSSEGTFKDAKK
jgi:predicted transcriptional regulator